MEEGVRERSVRDIEEDEEGKSSGPSEVTCEMFSNDVCVRELCGVANGLLMGESMPES